MLIRRILVHTDSSAEGAVAVKAATVVADKFKARLTGFFVMPDIALAAALPAEAAASPRLVEDMQAYSEKQAGAAEAIFRDGAGDLVAADGWIVADGMGLGSRDAAAEISHFADLIVATREDAANDERRSSAAMPQDLVVDSGRPLLLIPPRYGGEPIGRQIVVAWSNSREATRALYDALPFLTDAQRVHIVTVVDDDSAGAKPGERIAERLADYSVQLSVTVDVIGAKSGNSTSELLFDYVTDVEADLLVAGAFSHSRLREGLFGGVTKSIFESSPLPTLLSH